MASQKGVLGSKAWSSATMAARRRRAHGCSSEGRDEVKGGQGNMWPFGQSVCACRLVRGKATHREAVAAASGTSKAQATGSRGGEAAAVRVEAFQV